MSKETQMPQNEEAENKRLSVKERMALFERTTNSSINNNKIVPIKKVEVETETKKVDDYLTRRRTLPPKPKHLIDYKNNINNQDLNKTEKKPILHPTRPAPPPPLPKKEPLDNGNNSGSSDNKDVNNNNASAKSRAKQNDLNDVEKRYSLPKKLNAPPIPSKKEALLKLKEMNTIKDPILPPKLPNRNNSNNSEHQNGDIAPPKLPIRRQTEIEDEDPIQRKIIQIPKNDQIRYNKLYLTLKQNGNEEQKDKIMVSKVVELFLLSKLDVETLAKIWDICDIKQKGYLDKNSFILALYLIDQRLKGIKIC